MVFERQRRRRGGVPGLLRRAEDAGRAFALRRRSGERSSKEKRGSSWRGARPGKAVFQAGFYFPGEAGDPQVAGYEFKDGDSRKALRGQGLDHRPMGREAWGGAGRAMSGFRRTPFRDGTCPRPESIRWTSAGGSQALVFAVVRNNGSLLS